MSEKFPTCQVIPLPDSQISFEIDSNERMRWHFGDQYPRPFFYPLRGPSGKTLTRMGHPGAPDHDHHRSIWFAHHKLLGISFWSDQTDARIQQTQWLALQSSDEAAQIAVELKWYDGHDPAELLTQTVIAEVRPGSKNKSDKRFAETFLEIQTDFVPKSDSIEFQQTNFGFFAVRVAREISGRFGGGLLTNSKRAETEKNIFGKPATWMDYSGQTSETPDQIEGITYFDHPDNPNQPTCWHVREDGWMGASPCMHAPIETTKAKPLRLRYLLHAHDAAIDAERADAIQRQFAASGDLSVKKSEKSHSKWEINRG